MKDFGIDYSILVGGAAGQGIDTFASILEKTLKRCGYYVFTYRDYMSRVRGDIILLRLDFLISQSLHILIR